MFGDVNKTEIQGNDLLYTFTLKGPRAIKGFKDWIDAHPNEFKPIWVPTLQDELLLVSGPEGNKLTVRPQKIYTGKRDIAIVHTDDSKECRHIDSVEVKENGDQIITLDKPVSSSPPIKQICSLWFCRPVYNPTLVEWDGANTSQITLRFTQMISGSS